MNFSINLSADIAKIKSLITDSTEKMDFIDAYIEKNFGKNKTRKFVSAVDGMNFKLMVIHRYSYFQSPILKGKISKKDDNINSVNLSFSVNIIYILYISVIFTMGIFSLFDLINSQNYSVYLFIPSIFLFFTFYELFKIKIKMRELKSFLYRIYNEYIIENNDGI